MYIEEYDETCDMYGVEEAQERKERKEGQDTARGEERPRRSGGRRRPTNKKSIKHKNWTSNYYFINENSIN